MKHHTLAALAALALTAPAALALSTQDLIDRLSADGFTRIEVKSGPTQTKVEAVRGTEKVEAVYDTATGALLKRETETLAPGSAPAAGIEIDTRDRDFLRTARNDDRREDRRQDRRESADDEDDGDGDRGRGRGRGGDDGRDGDDDGDRGRGRGGDDGRDGDSDDD